MMGRLTYIDALGTGQIKGLQLLGCKWACDNSKNCEDCLVGNAITKLAEYEDLEEKNRLIKLPCEIGDMVFINTKSTVEIFAGIQPHKITSMMISKNKKGIWTKKYRASLFYNGKTTDMSVDFEFNEIGRTVFFTKEEAEQKLKEMEG